MRGLLLAGLCLMALLLAGCGGTYDARLERRLSELPPPGSRSNQAASPTPTPQPETRPEAAIDSRLYSAPTDVADKAGSQTGIRLHLPAPFFGNNAAQFQALTPGDGSSPELTARARIGGVLPAEEVLIAYEHAWSNPADGRSYPVAIVFARYNADDAQVEQMIADAANTALRRAPQASDLSSPQGNWRQWTLDGQTPFFIDGRVEETDGVVRLFGKRGNSGYYVIGYAAPRAAADALQWDAVAAASVQTAALSQ